MNIHMESLSRYLPFWESLPEDDKELISRNTSLIKYEKGASIHGGGNDCTGVLIVRKGALATYILSEEGREITLYRLYEGDICVLSASCLLKQITFDIHIDAETDSEIFLISPAAYDAVAQRNVEVMSFTYKLTTERFSDVMWTMQQILFMGFDKRLAVFLSDESAKTGSNVIKSTHEQIAKHIGSAREVVTRMLRRFADDGIVELSRGEIRITDKPGLKAIINGK